MKYDIDKFRKQMPLAALLRPETLDDLIGQDHLLGANKPLRRMVETGNFQSVILWGPPGVGKTSIASTLAKVTNAKFHKLNATEATVKDLRSLIVGAKKASPQKTIVFIDELHRWNKAQQDVMLPAVEDGTVILFGATTEKPKFAVNSTILSRCLVLEAKPLNKAEMLKLILKVKKYYESKGKSVKISSEVAKRLVNRCSGDARKLITVMETIIDILIDDGLVTVEHVDMAMPDKHIVFDARGNDHYDCAHCYQEAIQNSDTNGAIYWLAKWIQSGEDPAYISRRMLITAFEDCAGNPYAWLAAMAACFTAERTGLPECAIPMSLATCEMGMSRRNRTAHDAIKEAIADVDNNETIHVPPELRAGTHGYSYAITKEYLKGWKRDWE